MSCFTVSIVKSGPRKHRNDRRISPATAAHVKRRDQGCVAALWLGAQDLCKDEAKRPVSAYNESAWELDHVNDHDLGRSLGIALRLALLCSWHHRGGWATSHRVMLREYCRLREDGMGGPEAGRKARDLAVEIYGAKMKKGV